VVAALIERQGRLLICQRRRGDLFELQWEFPGGKLRPSETPRDALARELRAELGSTGRIGARIYRVRYCYKNTAQSLKSVSSRIRSVSSAAERALNASVWSDSKICHFTTPR
jgi:8-oxo-dGTP diphosphatase